MSAVPNEETVEAYVAWWQGLPQTLDRTESVFARNGRFVDPFSDIAGASRIRQHLSRAYGKLGAVRITVTDRAYNGRIAYLRWCFTFRLGGRGCAREIIGMSEVHFDEEGRVALHYDHWDAAGQVYEQIPLLGSLLRRIKARIGG